MAPLKEIASRLEKLRVLDTGLRVFGASHHRYQVASPLDESTLRRFERKHGIDLPRDYREFLSTIGNGGAGPFYGVFPLGMWDGAGGPLEAWRVLRKKGALASPFPLTEEWNLPPEQLECPASFASDEEEDAWNEALDEALYPEELDRGWLPICHHGCALRTYLVLSGPERGHVWYDGRPGGDSIRPHADAGRRRLTFSDWYDAWLERSLRELKP